MTTWESTDKIDNENLTVTSDAAFERVTSDEHFEDERNWGYLQQNTSWLVQEIPNIAFLDIADTMLESNKTLYNRENWVIRVGKAGRSIEAQPQDTLLLKLDSDATYIISPWYTDNYVDFDSNISSLNYTTVKPDKTRLANIYTFDILETWYYNLSYWWTLEPNSATWFRVTVASFDAWIIARDYYKDSSLPEILSWWKQIPNIYLEKWDSVYMKIEANDAIKMYAWTYMSIQFQQYIL